MSARKYKIVVKVLEISKYYKNEFKMDLKILSTVVRFVGGVVCLFLLRSRLDGQTLAARKQEEKKNQ